MKTNPVLTCLCFLLAPTILARVDGRPRPEDHLVPLRASVFDEFRPSVYQKLLLSPGNYGRMVEFVSEFDGGEFAVSVQCEERGPEGKQCSVTLTKLKQNLGSLWQENLGKRPLESISRIRAIRRDAPIAPAAASAIRSAWMKMLRDVKPRREDGSIVNDAERIEFFIGPPSPAGRIAQIPDEFGSTVNAFVELGRLLAKYCEAPQRARETMAQQIEHDAERFARSLR